MCTRAVQRAGIDPEAARKLVRSFVVGICRRRTNDADPGADQRACHDFARRLVARDPGLAARLHDILALDRVGIDADDDQAYITANALAIVVAETWHVLRHLQVSGDIDAARRAMDGLVKNWADLVAGVPGAIRRPPRSA